MSPAGPADPAELQSKHWRGQVSDRREKGCGDALSRDLLACNHRSMRRTRGERRAISEHLLCELQMMFLMSDRLRRHLSGECVLPADIRRACVESLVIHVRALEEFIWGNPREDHPHSALASDFFPAGEWEETRKRIQKSALRKVAPRAGREVAHLSYSDSAPLRRPGVGSSTSSRP